MERHDPSRIATLPLGRLFFFFISDSFFWFCFVVVVSGTTGWNAGVGHVAAAADAERLAADRRRRLGHQTAADRRRRRRSDVGGVAANGAGRLPAAVLVVPASGRLHEPGITHIESTKQRKPRKKRKTKEARTANDETHRPNHRKSSWTDRPTWSARTVRSLVLCDVSKPRRPMNVPRRGGVNGLRNHFLTPPSPSH